MNNNTMFSSETHEWYTPPQIISDVIEVMGLIDLDPCSPFPDGPVPATKHYTSADDGLSLNWDGRVYMNPPYGREISKWIIKVISEYQSGRTSEAVLLVPSRTDTNWFHMLGMFPWCAVRGRLKFSGHNNSAPFPSDIFYLGENVEKFNEVFSKRGIIFSLF